MLGIIYLILSVLIGYEISGILTGPKEISTDTNRIWLVLPASFGTGILVVTWAVYIISWFASVTGGSDRPLLYGNLIVLSAAVLILAFLLYRRKKKAQPMKPESMVTDRSRFRKELVFFGILLVFITYMMFYVFYIKDGVMYAGLTVCSDYAPHTAMMRSFSLGNNFPTQYPHFGGADVKYHFMFQFLAGNLEYLGLRLDLAYNLLSIGSLLGFLMLLYELALRITGRMCCGIWTIILFFFRSGMAFWRFLWEHLQAGDLLTVLQENTAFIGYTENENWGLWNFNVYLNQRHLAFGLLLVTLALYLFMDWLEAGISHEEKGLQWLGKRFTAPETWKCRQPEKALFMGLFLGLGAFWNGAAVIGGLLILMGFAIFSDGKLDYLITALVTVFFSFLQTKIFIRGSAMGFQLYLGFLAEEKTPWGVVKYLFWMGGIFFLGLLGLVVFLRRKGRVLAVSFLIPTIFAFTILMTVDINVNHKYIMISYAFLGILWAWAVCSLWRGKVIKKILAVVLAVCLTVTGVYDFVVILKGNGYGHRIAINMNSELTAWLAENLDKNDLLLTPEYSINEVTMSGVMLYCGWPYYAWSAGYDTYYRAAQAVTIYTTFDSELLKNLVKQEKITYILYEEDSQFEGQDCREDVIAENYELVYENPGGSIRIYKTSES
ncbi:hypothetical protein [Blautia luti]|uniref:hypothetical protein n=1 Tax=Blautia luti TaxID=89014 RepID=UPI0018ABF9A1|nr:hypothetical protein [Blautia luti]